MREDIVMEDLKRVIKFHMAKAVANPKNRFPNGDINWNFVDADTYMALNPVNETVKYYYAFFDEIAEEFV